MRKWTLPVLLVLVALGLGFGQANAASTDVPVNMRGVWGKYGRCDLRAARLTITAHRAVWDDGPRFKVGYDREFKEIFFVEEGVVTNFVLGRTLDVLVVNTQGFGMPGAEGYSRCGPKMDRVSWPPK